MHVTAAMQRASESMLLLLLHARGARQVNSLLKAILSKLWCLCCELLSRSVSAMQLLLDAWYTARADLLAGFTAGLGSLLAVNKHRLK
jgi:rhodanese-related sulfurtransferase